jgi:hypothetical protein
VRRGCIDVWFDILTHMVGYLRRVKSCGAAMRNNGCVGLMGGFLIGEVVILFGYITRSLK